MSIDLYYMVESPPCRAVLMVAKHLNIDLNMISLNLEKQEHMSEEFVKINPCHCVPTIVDNGFVLWESRAIITYLCDKYSKQCSLYPRDTQKRATIDRLLQFDISKLYSAVSSYLKPLLYGKPFDEQTNTELREALSIFNDMIAGKQYVCYGELTLADLSILSSLSLLECIDYDRTDFKHINEWLVSIKQLLPYYHEVSDLAVDNTRNYLKSLRK